MNYVHQDKFLCTVWLPTAAGSLSSRGTANTVVAQDETRDCFRISTEVMLGLEIRFRVWICSQYLHFQILKLKIFSRKVCFTEKLFLSTYVSKIHYSGSSGAEQHLFQDSVIQKRITLITKSLFSLFCLPSMSHLKSQFSGPAPVTVKINRKGFLWIRQDSQPAGAAVCSWLSSQGTSESHTTLRIKILHVQEAKAFASCQEKLLSKYC